MAGDALTRYAKGIGFSILGIALMVCPACRKGEDRKPEGAGKEKEASTQTAGAGATPAGVPKGMMELVLDLPPHFYGHPLYPPDPDLEPPRYGPRPKFYVPVGCTNVALGKKVTSSDPEPIFGELSYVTDGEKAPGVGFYVELGPGTQWVQIDLDTRYRIYAVVIWHEHSLARIYKDVVVQVSEDQDWRDRTTLFNNDRDNSSGLGAGKDHTYKESEEGKLIDGKGTRARYVRLYSKGNSLDFQNQYTELEVYALPAK